MAALDIDALRAAPLARDPYDHVIVPGFVQGEALQPLVRDYPRIDRAGSFPVAELQYGPAFGALLDELDGAALRVAIEQKFSLDLAGRPTLVTVRGRCQEKDGQIHTDSKDKIITVLLYLNERWQQPGGRLRILKDGHDVDNFAAAVPTGNGTLLVVKRSDNSWHGHHPFEGQRRSLQMNWMTSEGSKGWHKVRHTLSAAMKKLTAA